MDDYQYISTDPGAIDVDSWYQHTARRNEDSSNELRAELAAERQSRAEVERRLDEISAQLLEMQSAKRKRKSETEIESEEPIEVSDFKSDGKRKPHAADSIRSYEDFYAIQKYFLEKNNIRDWMLWTIGVSLGLRISDLLSLRIRNLLTGSPGAYQFRDRIYIVEKKTNKANNCLITESVRQAVTKYLDSIDWKFSLDDYLFRSRKTKGKMYEEYGWKILSDAGRVLGLPINVGSHTMRKSFANIAACVDKSAVDMNSITKIQGLLNHSSQQVTMKYLGTFQGMFDRAREAVSDFVLGKTDVHELVAGNNYTLDDIVSKLDSLESKLDT